MPSDVCAFGCICLFQIRIFLVFFSLFVFTNGNRVGWVLLVCSGSGRARVTLRMYECLYIWYIYFNIIIFALVLLLRFHLPNMHCICCIILMALLPVRSTHFRAAHGELSSTTHSAPPPTVVMCAPFLSLCCLHYSYTIISISLVSFVCFFYFYTKWDTSHCTMRIDYSRAAYEINAISTRSMKFHQQFLCLVVFGWFLCCSC